MTNLSSAAVDTSLIGIDEGDEYTFKYTENIKGDPLFMDQAKTLKVNSGEEYTIEVKSLPDEGKSDVTYQITTESTSDEIKDDLSSFGQPGIHTDWDFWSDTANIEDISTDQSSGSVTENTTENNGVFEYRYSLNMLDISTFNVQIFYNMEDGMMERFWMYAEMVDLTTGKLSVWVDYLVERTQTNYASAPISTGTVVFALIMLPIIVRKKLGNFRD